MRHPSGRATQLRRSILILLAAAVALLVGAAEPASAGPIKDRYYRGYTYKEVFKRSPYRNSIVGASAVSAFGPARVFVSALGGYSATGDRGYVEIRFSAQNSTSACKWMHSAYSNVKADLECHTLHY